MDACMASPWSFGTLLPPATVALLLMYAGYMTTLCIRDSNTMPLRMRTVTQVCLSFPAAFTAAMHAHLVVIKGVRHVASA